MRSERAFISPEGLPSIQGPIRSRLVENGTLKDSDPSSMQPPPNRGANNSRGQPLSPASGWGAGGGGARGPDNTGLRGDHKGDRHQQQFKGPGSPTEVGDFEGQFPTIDKGCPACRFYHFITSSSFFHAGNARRLEV